MVRRETISPQKLLLKVLITPKTKRDSIYFYFRNSNLEVSPNIVEESAAGMYEKLKISGIYETLEPAIPPNPA